MSELTFSSAGVSIREIDLSGPTNVQPSGIPAGVVGTSLEGPAFVPLTFGTVKDFYARFGKTDGEKFGPLAVTEWMRNANAVTYLRVLGVGDGTKRSSTDGSVTRAGFVVGQQEVQSNGIIGRNTKAYDEGDLGRTHFLGCFMSESAGSTYFSAAGIDHQYTSGSVPIIRGVILAASGVVLSLSGNNNATNVPLASAARAGTYNGYFTGSVDLSSGKQEFKLLLNGHINTSDYPNFMTASFDPTSQNYFAKVMNRDPELLEKAGYVLYSHYDIHPNIAVVTGSGLLNVADSTLHVNNVENVAFVITGSGGRNVGSTTYPNYESFTDRFRTAFSPFVVSQKFGSTSKNLFRIHALSDGVMKHLDRTTAVPGSNNKFKISIQNIASSKSSTDKFGTFDLVVRDFYDTDENAIVLEQFRGINLNPKSDRYIGRIIGDQNVYFDFDKVEGEQRLVIEGNHGNRSNLIRVEIDSEVENESVDPTALPVGFRGPYHLVTSGSSMLNVPGTGNDFMFANALARTREPPVPFRQNLKIGTGVSARSNNRLHWGVQFEKQTSATEYNKTLVFNPSLESYTKYFPMFNTTNLNVWVGNNEGVADLNGSILDADRFNKNLFTMENIQVKTGSDGKVDTSTVVDWIYVRQGGISANEANKTRALNVTTDFGVTSLKPLNKFTFFMQGGFDGVDIFNEEKSNLSDLAIRREINDANQGNENGPSVRAYKKALEIMGNSSEVDIQLLAIPGIRHTAVTDLAITTVEDPDRFDALYLMDIEEKDTSNNFVTGSSQLVDVSQTVSNFTARALDSSFGAAYFPDVLIPDPNEGNLVQVPPSVVVLGALALNDRIGHPWFAPAGFTRGALSSTQDISVRLNKENLDNLYEANINPLTSFPGQDGVVVWGQKTLQAAQSSLDRINVRRLLIDIRRKVRGVANSLLFEPNREETLNRFSAAINPLLQKIQEQQGLDRYKVIVDTTTTTQVDVENNTIRGKIYVQPTRTAEFVSIDFVVANAGNI